MAMTNSNSIRVKTVDLAGPRRWAQRTHQITRMAVAACASDKTYWTHRCLASVRSSGPKGQCIRLPCSGIKAHWEHRLEVRNGHPRSRIWPVRSSILKDGVRKCSCW